MKKCDNSTRKVHTNSNFILSISLLIMFDTLLIRPSLHCNTLLHFITLHPTTLHHTSPNYTSLHFTQLHFTTLHPTTPHYTLLHSTTLIDTSLPLLYTLLPFCLALRIYISYCSISLHITSFTSHHINRSHPQNYFQKNKPLHCPKELLTISLYFTFYFIYLFVYLSYQPYTSLYFPIPKYNLLPFTSLFIPFTSLFIPFTSTHRFTLP
jgi:hypothetical protein